MKDGGSDSGRLNVVLLAEGYTEAERPFFEAHAKQLAAVIKSEPWYRHGLLNLHAFFVPSKQSARYLKPKAGPLNTAFKAEYGQGARAGHVISGDDAAVKQHLTGGIPATNEHIIMLVNCSLYGGKGGGEGGGICWTYTDRWNPQRWTACGLHEWGHVLGLADEYGGSGNAYRSQEPREPNITLDPRGAKWRHLVQGAVEGAAGYEYGIYRPTRDCRMRSFAGGFCPVCSDHIRRELEGYLTEEPVEPAELVIQTVRPDGERFTEGVFPDDSAGCMAAVQWLLKRQFG